MYDQQNAGANIAFVNTALTRYLVSILFYHVQGVYKMVHFSNGNIVIYSGDTATANTSI